METVSKYLTTNRNENGNLLDLSDILKSLEKCNEMKYASYRMASKIKIIQKALRTDIITLPVLSAVFEQHRFSASERSFYIEPIALEALLSDIYFASNKLGEHCVDVEACVNLTMQLFLLLFNGKIEGALKILSTKLMLCILSSSTVDKKCQFMFYHTADHNQSVTRMKLKSMLRPLATLGDFLGEGLWFGSHLITAVVNDCFVTWPGCLGLMESAFHNWLATYPDWFSWLHVLEKLNKYDNFIHPYKCSNCNIDPIEGLAFRCRKCRYYNQCVQCFSRASYSDTHKPTHKMQEIQSLISQRDPKKLLRSQIQSILGRFNCLRKESNDLSLRSSNSAHMKIINTHQSGSVDNLNEIDQSKRAADISKVKLSKSIDNIRNSKHAYKLQSRIQYVIEQLELQLKEIRSKIASKIISNIDPLDISNQLNALEMQVTALKSIKNAIKSSFVISTPLPKVLFREKHAEMNLLSPILVARPKEENDRSFSQYSFDKKEGVGGVENFITVQSYIKRHLRDEIRSKPFSDVLDVKESYRDVVDISSFHSEDDTEETYSTDACSDFEQKSSNETTSKNDLADLIKKMHDLLNVSVSCDNRELSKSANRLESVLSNIIDSLEIERCLHDLKKTEVETNQLNAMAGCSSQM